MIWGLLVGLACSPAQLTEAGQRVRGRGEVEQAMILAEVGCLALADRRLDGILARAQGQYRLHGLFARGRVASLRCRIACTTAERQRGLDALRQIEREATAAGQIEVARRLRLGLAPPPPAAPPVAEVSAAPVAMVAPEPAPGPPTAVATNAPKRGEWRTATWIGAGVLAAGALGTGLGAASRYDDARRFSAARTPAACGGRDAAACRAAWRSADDDAHLLRNLSVACAGAALLTGALGWWLTTPAEVDVAVGPGSVGARMVW